MAADVDLAAICCFKCTRTVVNDNTVPFDEHRLQLQRISYAKASVEVQERLDGSLAVYHQGEPVAHQPVPADAAVLRARTGRRPEPSPSTTVLHELSREDLSVVAGGVDGRAGASAAVNTSTPRSRAVSKSC